MKRTEHGGIFFRLLFLLGFCCLLGIVYVARHPLMRFAAETWVVDEPAAPCDAVVVLGDDNFKGDRAFHAADLYRAGAAPVVVASGRMMRQNASVADLIQHDLESFGVPAASIVKLMHRADNTREEAGEVARLVQARGWKSIIVVTSNYHTRRARFIFERVLPANIRLRVSAARDSDFDPAHWWESRQGRKLFMMELAGYLVARWELRSGAAAENSLAMVVQISEALEKGQRFVIPSEAKNLSSISVGAQRDSSAKNPPRNDKKLLFLQALQAEPLQMILAPVSNWPHGASVKLARPRGRIL